jgi:hypothetical protein
MPKKLLLGVLFLVTMFSSLTACDTISNIKLPSNIATVEIMEVGIRNMGYYSKDGLYVKLKPTNAKAGVYYTVDLYEKGIERNQATSVIWNQAEINIKTLATAYFPLSEDEILAYHLPSIQDDNWWKSIFSVKVHEPLPPTITIISPNGGEIYHMEDWVNINWESTNLPDNCVIVISYIESNNSLASFLSENTGIYEWRICAPIQPTTHARIQIEAIANGVTVATTTSTSNFTILDTTTTSTQLLSSTSSINITTTPTITLIYPKGGEIWYVGDTVTITWTSSNLPKDAPIFIGIGSNGSGTWITGVETVPNTGSYQWTVTKLVAGHSIIGTHESITIGCKTINTYGRGGVSADFTIAER